MHSYSINLKERINVVGVLGFLSIVIVLVIKDLVNGDNIPSWLPVPSAFAVFGVLFLLFNKVLWKWSWINPLLISTPNLNGRWTMLMRSSLDNFKEDYEGILTISQTWSKIFLYLDGEKFTGKSGMAGIEVHTMDSFTLKWEYLAQRKPELAANEYMHHGMTTVVFKKGEKEAKGNYYADQSRHSFGPVTLIKKA